MKTKALDRDDRKRQIMLAFAVNIQSGHDGRMTLADVARAVGLSVSTKLRDMIVELELEGLIDHVVEPMPGIVGKRFIYAPTEIFDARHGRKRAEPRIIAIKGKRNGQQAMWDEVLS